MARRTPTTDGTTTVTTPTPARSTRSKKPKEVAAPTPAPKVTKASLVQAEYLKDPNARPIDVARATGVDPVYVWDIRAAMQRKGTIPTPAKVEAAAKAKATPAPAPAKPPRVRRAAKKDEVAS